MYLLEAITVLQLDCSEIIDEISRVLKTIVMESVRFEQIFYIWNIAVTYELSAVLDCVMAEVESKLETFITNAEDLAWLNMLGWEEIKDIITRNGICLESESLLLDFVLKWAEDKVSDIEDYQTFTDLLLNLRNFLNNHANTRMIESGLNQSSLFYLYKMDFYSNISSDFHY